MISHRIFAFLAIACSRLSNINIEVITLDIDVSKLDDEIQKLFDQYNVNLSEYNKNLEKFVKKKAHWEFNILRKYFFIDVLKLIR